MRLPITDQFLWLIYEVYEKLGEILEPPEIFKLRGWSEISPPHPTFWEILEKKRQKRQFSQFVNYLKKKGYIKIANLKEKEGILLTKKVREKTLKIKFKMLKLLKKNKRRDGKWLMVIFDVPEKMRVWRNSFREFLYSLGFKKLQKSVWISPYDVYKEIEEIARVYSLDKFIKIFLIKEMEI
jgi:CRISPR-associated endonuclease Cas2